MTRGRLQAMPRSRNPRNRVPPSYPQSYFTIAQKFLDSRIATIANHARVRMAAESFNDQKEMAVADIVVQCPRTGTPVPTGLKSEWVFLRSLPRVAIPLRCPACGQTHRWQPQEAWIAAPVQPHAVTSA